jgi:hypothetical protein
MAGVAAAATLCVFLGGVEPRNIKRKEQPPAAEAAAEKLSFGRAAYRGVSTILTSTKTVFRVPSFQIILVAGIVGAIAMMGMGYKVMYFQVRG